MTERERVTGVSERVKEGGGGLVLTQTNLTLFITLLVHQDVLLGVHVKSQISLVLLLFIVAVLCGVFIIR